MNQPSISSVISIRDLRKSYPEFQLGPLSLELEPGYVYTIMGPNGSGKSTLFRALMEQVRPDEGEIHCFGRSRGDSLLEVKRRIAYVPEALDIPNEGWSLQEWHDFVAHWYPNWNEELYQSLVSRYELPSKRPIKQFSKGMRRKAALILALAQEPDVLLLDEPSSGLDPMAWRYMFEDLAAYMDQGGRTIVLASHIVEEIRRLADYVIFMQAGSILGQYEKDELLNQWRMLWLNRMPEESLTLPGVIAVEQGPPVRIITNRPQDTELACREQRIIIDNTNLLELSEIFYQLVRMKDKAGTRREPGVK